MRQAKAKPIFDNSKYWLSGPLTTISDTAGPEEMPDEVRDLARRRNGSKLVISVAHNGPKAAMKRAFEGAGVLRLFQRINPSRNEQLSPVHSMRNVPVHVHRGQQKVVTATIHLAFDQPDRAAAGSPWRTVADQLRRRWPKLAEPMDNIANAPTRKGPDQARVLNQRACRTAQGRAPNTIPAASRYGKIATNSPE